jgi:membrane protein DedA with SNARE-associated domain
VRTPVSFRHVGTGTDVPRRIPLPYLLVPFGVVAALAQVGNAIGPTLITHHPLLEIVLNPINRYLILAAPQVSIVPFFVIGFARLILTDPIAFILGRQYGDAALTWAEGKTGAAGEPGLVRRMERLFNKAAPVFIVIAPSFIWCLMAGNSRMKTWVFVTCNFVGTVGRLTLIWMAGDAFESQLNSVLDVIRRFQVPLLVLTVSMVLIQTLRSRKRGDLETPAEMEAQIEAELSDDQ